MNIDPTPVRYPIDIRCPIGGGVFAKGKAGKFSVGGTPTEGESLAAGAYKYGSYTDMNNALRGKENATAETKEKISAMHDMISRSKVADSGVVYRAVDGLFAGKALESKVGQKITFNGFTSTSTSKAVARNWTSSHGKVLFRIYVPKGANAFSYAAMTKINDPMHEVVLPHNSKFTVHSASKDKKGQITVDLIMHR